MVGAVIIPICQLFNILKDHGSFMLSPLQVEGWGLRGLLHAVSQGSRLLQSRPQDSLLDTPHPGRGKMGGIW